MVHFVYRGNWQEEFFYSPLSNLCQEQLGALWHGAWSPALLSVRFSLWLRPVEYGERLPGSENSTVLSEIPGIEEWIETRYVSLNNAWKWCTQLVCHILWKGKLSMHWPHYCDKCCKNRHKYVVLLNSFTLFKTFLWWMSSDELAIYTLFCLF